MKILSVTDPAFRPYGRVVEGYPVEGILEALKQTPCPENVIYKPMEPAIHAAPHAEAVGEALFGGMPFQLGYCNGRNTKLNCLEYHRDSEFNLGTEDFILLLARQDELDAESRLDVSKVKAFRVPAGVLVECYATTLHYAPCQASKDKGYQVLIALPQNTNTDYRPGGANVHDRTLWARNKWLIAHPDTSEAAQGAYVGLMGENIDIACDL